MGIVIAFYRRTMKKVGLALHPCKPRERFETEPFDHRRIKSVDKNVPLFHGIVNGVNCNRGKCPVVRSGRGVFSFHCTTKSPITGCPPCRAIIIRETDAKQRGGCFGSVVYFAGVVAFFGLFFFAGFFALSFFACSRSRFACSRFASCSFLRCSCRRAFSSC